MISETWFCQYLINEANNDKLIIIIVWGLLTADCCKTVWSSADYWMFSWLSIWTMGESL